MRILLLVLSSCVLVKSYSAIPDFYDRGRDNECPAGSRCMSADLCPGAAQPFGPFGPFGPSGREGGAGKGLSHGLGLGLSPGLPRGPARCSPHLPGTRVCCWTPNALPQPGLPLLRSARQASRPSQRACEEYQRLSPRLRRSTRNQGDNVPYVPFVVGGQNAKNKEFPYMVAIGYVRGNSEGANLQWHCGGSLVSDRYVLTAAHCITDARRRNLRPVALRTAVTDLAQGPRLPSDYSVENITLHPRHRADRKYFDLALLRTDRPVRLSDEELPVCLAAPDLRLGADTPLVVAGWGATDPQGFEKSAALQRAEVREVPLEECRTLIKQRNEIPRGVDSSMLCAADPQRKADTCVGDSGGPIAVRTPRGDVLVGVTSFGGLPCASATPGVYARVLPELDWIESIVWS